jgi:Tol biopolymer transport system component
MAPIVSPDGRYVVFASTANNLIALRTNQPLPAVIPPPMNVFLRDRTSATTTLISLNVSGTGGGNDNSWPVAVSTNGRYVLFESSANNLVADDTNNATDIFVRDLVADSTLLVSSSANGAAGNGTSQGSAMTPDGHYVAFLSGANNLVPGDTNGIPDVFVRDLQGGVTTLASPGAGALGYVNTVPLDDSPGITPDGRYVVFHSTTTNLVPGVTTRNDIYVRDLLSGTTIQASADALAAVQALMGSSNATCRTFNFVISADGQFVVYEASPSSASAGIILRYNLQTGSTDIVHTNAAISSTTDSRSLDMTPDGTVIAFVANTNGSSGTDSCILVWDAQTASLSLASGDAANTVPAGSTCDWPALTPDGRFVAFLSSAPNLVTNALVGDYHLYLRDRQAATTTLLDANTNGVGSRLTSMPIPALSADGRLVAFECSDGSLVPKNGNRCYEVFMLDRLAGVIELISTRDPALSSFTSDGPSTLSGLSISADGRFVAFTSEADNLVVNDTNGCRDVFVHDFVAETNLLISVAADGISAGNNLSFGPAISGDGRYVAFTSSADNLVAGDTNKSQDVFLRDLQTATTQLISVSTNLGVPGNQDSYSPVISSDGRYIQFRSKANNLAPGLFNGENLFLWDAMSGATYALTTNGVAASAMASDGRFSAFVSTSQAYGTDTVLSLWDSQLRASVYTTATPTIGTTGLSPDGKRVVYSTRGGIFFVVPEIAHTNGVVTSYLPATRPGFHFSSDGRFFTYAAAVNIAAGLYTNQIYLYDFLARSNLLVSRSYNAFGPANHDSYSPDISSDGRFVAYQSEASDLVPGDDNGLPDIFLFDRVAGTTTLVSASHFGSDSANNRSLSPIFAGQSEWLFFESWASDLVDGDFYVNSDIFEFKLQAFEPLSRFNVAIRPAPSGTWITWPVLPGKSYRVQYRDSMSDGLPWQDLAGGVTVLGNTGSFRDLAASASQRFYRVVAF